MAAMPLPPLFALLIACYFLPMFVHMLTHKCDEYRFEILAMAAFPIWDQLVMFCGHQENSKFYVRC